MKHQAFFVRAFALFASLGAVCPTVHAQQNLSLTANASVVSDYRYRGITQTRFDPALQVGADLSLPDGFYLGAWATNIKWLKDAGQGGKGSSEIDFYGGYKTPLGRHMIVDIGALRYQYPGNNYALMGQNDNANTTELYAALSFGHATLKYSRAVTSLFGWADSKGSGYLDLSANFDLGAGWSLTPHIGRQTVARHGLANYTDYALSINKEVAGFVFGANYIAVDARDESMYRADGKFAGKSGLIFSAKYNF